MSTFFFNTENSVNQAWADVLEGLNCYYAGKANNLEPLKIGGLTDHDQQVNSYVKIDRKLGLYYSQEGELVLSMATPIKEQTVGIKKIDFEKVKEILDTGIKVLYFGYIFKESAASQNRVIQESCLFGRDALQNRLTNFDTGEPIEDTSASIWMAFYKIKNCDIYYVVLNDNLVDCAVERSSEAVPDIRKGADVYEFINSHDGNFKQAVFTPTLISDAKFFGDNIIFTTEDKVEIDIFGGSQLHKIAGRFLKSEELPEAEIQFESSEDASINGNVITVNMSGSVGTLSYRWVTGTELDYIASPKEKIRYDFVIIKK